MNIRRIVITGDPQRPIPPQETNIRWLHSLVRHQLELLSGIRPEVLLSGSFVSQTEWLDSFDPRRPSWIAAHDLADTLVIGFEMPHNMVKHLSDNHIAYIDLICHPIRFLHDLCFGFKSNVVPMDRIGTFVVPETSIRLTAELVRNQLVRQIPVNLPDNSFLIVGQTQVDRSVVSAGRCLALDDFSEVIKTIASNGHPILFKPHPARPEDAANGLMKSIGATLVSDNVYAVMSSPRLAGVAGISSSCLHEAPYFGKRSIHFHQTGFEHYAPIITDEFLNLPFWRCVLDGLCEVKNQPERIWLPARSSRLRRSCNGFWGYDILEH